MPALPSVNFVGLHLERGDIADVVEVGGDRILSVAAYDPHPGRGRVGSAGLIVKFCIDRWQTVVTAVGAGPPAGRY